jgi:ABC-type sugar transport system, periplasmic component
MKAIRKYAMLAVSFVLVISLLAACSSGGGNSAPSATGGAAEESKSSGEKLPVRFLLPGNEPEDLAVVVEAINKKMADDGLNLVYQPIYLAWDVWDQRSNLMLTTGEEFELIAIMHDAKGPQLLAGNGGIIPIDDLLDKYGPDLKKSMPDWIWDSVKIGGQTISVPNFWADTAFSDGMVTMRSDLLAATGMQPPKSPEELLEAAAKIQEIWPDDNKNVYVKMLSEPAYYLHPTYETYPFTVVENMIYVDQEGNVKSWLETEEFKKDVTFMRQLYERKLVHPDILTVPGEVINQEEIAGRYLFRQGDVGLSEDVKARFPDAENKVYYLTDSPKFRSYAIRNSNGVSSTTKHPEAAIQFLNWVYAKQENFDLVTYGIKDVHWKETGDNLKDTLKKNQNGGASYELANWLLGHVEMNRYPTNYDKDRLERRTTISDDTLNSITIGFNFDPTNVAAEYANTVAEMKTSVEPLRFGVVSYEQAFDKVLANMKAAGLDRVVAEYEKQFKEWLASR